MWVSLRANVSCAFSQLPCRDRQGPRGRHRHSWKEPGFLHHHLRTVTHGPEQDVSISVKALKLEGLFVIAAPVTLSNATSKRKYQNAGRFQRIEGRARTPGPLAFHAPSLAAMLKYAQTTLCTHSAPRRPQPATRPKGGPATQAEWRNQSVDVCSTPATQPRSATFLCTKHDLRVGMDADPLHTDSCP